MNVSYTCKSCGKKVSVNKYSYGALASQMCRSCKMKKTYEDPSLRKRALSKRKETCKNLYGKENVAQNPEIKNLMIQTKKERYGYVGAFQDPGLQEKIQAAAHSESAYKRKRATCKERYGKDHHTQSSEWWNNYEANNLERTGFRNPMQDPIVISKIIQTYGRIGAVKNYRYNGIYFDSSWELAYYLWLKDNQKQFIYHPPTPLQYIEDGKIHYYHPDFLVEGEFIEIKGSQFFNENGEPFNKYLGKYWWGKYNALKENNVKILLHEDLTPILKEIQASYGKDFFKKCRVQKESKG